MSHPIVTFSLDYIVLQTQEGEAISALLAGYIDILLKKRNDVGSMKDEDDAQYALEEPGMYRNYCVITL